MKKMMKSRRTRGPPKVYTCYQEQKKSTRAAESLWTFKTAALNRLQKRQGKQTNYMLEKKIHNFLILKVLAEALLSFHFWSNKN